LEFSLDSCQTAEAETYDTSLDMRHRSRSFWGSCHRSWPGGWSCLWQRAFSIWPTRRWYCCLIFIFTHFFSFCCFLFNLV